ncbi:hypothetical protein RESH_00523 [Rhodopirellula europaea SH398]|uniref:Uncharacterized protein n=1 Tax=Rhodopirellula europaea SH398 TaxID=1263868 RepID=M5SB88_9BACT|nr:hypothetical protein RESH_00523 [Rhodopirellula europaea SH398]
MLVARIYFRQQKQRTHPVVRFVPPPAVGADAGWLCGRAMQCRTRSA